MSHGRNHIARVVTHIHPRIILDKRKKLRKQIDRRELSSDQLRGD